MIQDLIIRFWYQHKGLVLTNALFMVLSPVNDILIPHLYSKVIDAIKTDPSVMVERVTRPLIVLTAVFILVFIGGLGLDWHNSILQPQFESFVRNSMIQSVMHANEQNLKDIPVGDFLAKLISIPPTVLAWYSRFKDYLIPYILVFIAAVGYFLYYDWVLGISLFVLIGILSWVFWRTPRVCDATSRKTAQIEHGIHESIEDVLRNMVTIQESDQSRSELARLQTNENRYIQSFRRTMTCVIQQKMIAIPTLIAFIILFVTRCIYKIQNRSMRVSTFIALFLMLSNMITNLTWVIDIIRDSTFNVGSFKEIDAFMKEFGHPLPESSVSTIRDCMQRVQQETSHETGILFQNVTYQWKGSEKPLLENLTLHFNLGERTVLTGEIGSGKTTLLKLIVRMIEPTAGEILLDGIPYRCMKPAALRAFVRYVPQNPTLLNRSIMENILYGNTATDPFQVIALLKQLDMYQDFARFDPSLTDLPVGKNGSKLSGGQRQFICCLRALLRNPKYIVLDEPTASMDGATKKLLVQLLDHFSRTNRTIASIIVTHDAYLLQQSGQRLIVMDQGRIVRDTASQKIDAR